MDLKGKTVVVTGGASGIGLALVREFLKRGCRVAALDVSADGLEAVKRENAGKPLRVFQADVSDRETYHALLDTVLADAPPDVFVNNAGIAKAGSLLEAGLPAAEKTLRVNLDGVLYGTYYALRRMQAAGGGVIVNIASMAGHMPSPFLSSYSASKYAVVGLSRSLRRELAVEGSPVRVCLVSPGFINTAIIRQDGFEIPKWLMWTVSTPESVASKVADGVAYGCDEIYPDWGGKMLRLMTALLPEFLLHLSAKILISGSKRPRK